MNVSYTTLEGKSSGYKALAFLLALIALAGLVAFGVSYLQGHQVLGGNNAVPWGMPVVLAIYLIGLSAGSLIMSSLTYVFGREEYKPIARMAVYLAILLIFGAMIAIAVDLGRPEKFWRLFMFFYLNNMTSMFAVNSILYGGYFLISLTYLGLIFANFKHIRIMGMIAIGWAMLVHMGTGAIFGFIAARETWFSALRPLEFVSAALSSGMALLILVVILTMKFSGRETNRKTIASLGRLLALFIIVLAVLVVVDRITHFYPAGREATLYMLGGHYAWIFWVFQIGMGVVVPLAILSQRRLSSSVGWVGLAALSVVVGVFFERFYLVIPGAAYPFPLYHSRIEGMWGALGSFPIEPVEMIFSIGLLALVALLFVLGLKYLELLPAREQVLKEEINE